MILHDAIAEILRLSRELGLSPAVRHSLSVKRDEDGSRLLD
jgi:phage terminase small subunit